MKKLNYEILKELKYDGYLLREAPERVLQFGEGNFLRAFVDYFVDVLNEKTGFCSKIVMLQPTGGGKRVRKFLDEQEGLYTLLLRGNENGRKISEKRVISSVSRCMNPYEEYETYIECAKNPDLRFIISNTTEAGIRYDASNRFTDRPAASFPGKLTQFLYARYQIFGTEKGKGFVILPCELIDQNGEELKKCVLAYARQWELEADFVKWLEEENYFCSTLVDRIVTGYPASEAEEICSELGYEDNIIDTAESFGLWVIEGPEWLKKELPIEEAKLPVLITRDHRPYKQRKVRILNGAHTAMVLGAYLAGENIVRDCMNSEVIRGFMEKAVYEEIIPTLTLPEEELREFAKAVTDRFSNPFIDHELLAISLNSTSKWRARVLPSLKEYVKRFDTLPHCLVASLAFYIAFYRGTRMDADGFFGMRGNKEYKICDDRTILEFYERREADTDAELAEAVLANTMFWGEDLTAVPGLKTVVADDLRIIRECGALELMQMRI